MNRKKIIHGQRKNILSLRMLYHLGNVVKILLEFDGETVLNGEEDGASVLNIDPGIQPKGASDGI